MTDPIDPIRRTEGDRRFRVRRKADGAARQKTVTTPPNCRLLLRRTSRSIRSRCSPPS